MYLGSYPFMIVPFNQSPATRQARGGPETSPAESPPDVFLAMAAAQMHAQGRLFETESNIEIAGDVVPIRPPGSPANTSGRSGQTKNQGAQSPNTSAPGSNISRIYG